MRRVLILGGTGWLGREIARLAVAAGDSVTCLARGESGAAPAGIEFVQADRRKPGAYATLQRDWDEVIELAYEPELVQPALDALARHAAHWTLVSTVSVYASNDSLGPNEPLADETAALVHPTDMDDYGHAKAAAEAATAAALGGRENRPRLLTVRPGLIVGPGDPTDRFGYWPARLQRGAAVLAPDTQSRFVQVIDVADLAEWLVRAGRERRTGIVNAVGDVHPMADFFAQALEAVRSDADLVTAEDAWLVKHGVNYWAGPHSLPLWIPTADAGLTQRSNRRYLEAGGTLRPLHETIERSLADEVARGVDRARRSGLSSAEERELLTALARDADPGAAFSVAQRRRDNN